ncbi:MAG: surface carbohydrate biosynthesis protein [Erysipelotrichales bacterium]|nr:surface carbohydrate biosynthesis protein [Erysipelotrichales bacterium]
MKKVDFLLLYEYRTRELDSMCLLKCELEKRGYSVAMSNIIFFNIGKIYNEILAKVIIVPYFYDENNIDILLDNFKHRFDFNIVNMQSEQVLNNSTRDSGYYDIRGAARNAYHVCWGNSEKQFLISNGIKESKCLCTGSVNTDFDRLEFRTYFLSRDEISAQFNLNLNSNWVLFISSFSYTTLTTDELQEIKTRTNFSDADEFTRWSIKSKEKILEWIEKYLIKNSDITFIYRPHPSERSDKALIDLEKKYNNFRVICDYSIQQWIISSNVICNWFSTSFADAYFINKPCYLIRPLIIPENFEVDILHGIPTISTFEEFSEYCCGEIREVPKAVSDKMSSFYIFDNYPSYKKLCDELIKILETNTFEFRTKGTGSFVKNIMKSLINTISTKICIANLVGTKNKNFYRMMFKENHRILDEIEFHETKIKSIINNEYEEEE